MAPSLTLVAQTKMARYSIGMQETTKGWEKSFQLILGLGLTALFFFMMAPFMVAILFAAVITIVAYPLYSKLRRSLPPPAAAILITLGITLGVLIPLAFLLVGGAYQVLAWVRTFPAPTVENFQSLVERFHLQKLLNFASPYVSLDMNWLQSNAMGILEGTLTRISQFSTGFISGIPSLFLGVSVVIVGIYFFLVDGSKLLLFLAKVSPMKPERSRDLYLSFEKSCRGVVLAMLVSCLIQAILVFMFFILTGVPNAPLFGLSSFIMGMVPVVGVAPITLGASLYLF
jgi:predicted PurR-regulated permease PerM